MDIFGRRRRANRQEPTPTQQDLTGYEEKTVFSTEPPVSSTESPVNVAPGYGYSQQQAPVEPNYGAAGYTPQQTSGYNGTVTEFRDLDGEVRTERPMVFAMRAIPDMYVYEYSDRLEYYLRTPSSMFKYKTVMKQR